MAELLPGTEVRARGLRWEVVDLSVSGEETRYRLRGLEGALRGHEIHLLHPFEDLVPLQRDLNPAKPGRLQQWRLYHEAFLLDQALGPGALLAAQPGRLTIAPYQLVPVMRALRLSRVRLLLADGVGLGKTIQAGLVMAELIARRRAHRILIVAPAGPLMDQWRAEMRERFGLRFDILDRDRLQEIRVGTELGANPFDHVALGLISVDYAKQERVLQELERTQYDLVVIDEAHHCMRLGGVGDREDSLRRRLAEVLAQQSDNLLLLTATPHDGYDPHFDSLIELLDPSLVDGRGALKGEAWRRHVVRRLKAHVKDPITGRPMFRTRKVTPIAVPFATDSHPAFVTLQRGLIELVAPRLKTAMRKRRYGDVLAFVSLLKRSVSSVAACKRTLQTIAGRFGDLVAAGAEDAETRKQRLATLQALQRRLARFGVLSPEEERDQATLEAEDMAAELFNAEDDAEATKQLLLSLDALRREARSARTHQKKISTLKDGLDELVELANAALAEDPKLDAVANEIARIRGAEPKANVLIYSEYVDSQVAVAERLRAAIEKNRLTGQVLTLAGGDDYTTDGDRESVLTRFQNSDDLVLVSTDAAAEGLNLHARCHHLIHVELPYNPNRLEQRNGRIDRFGQRFDPEVSYLYLRGTFEERLLLRLIAKYEKQRARLSFMPDTLGAVTLAAEDTTGRLLAGLVEDELSLFRSPAKTVDFNTAEDDDTDGTAYRELLGEIDKAMRDFEKASKNHAWLADAGLNADEKLLAEAAKARTDAQALGVVDLLTFVKEAVRADSAVAGAVKDTGVITELRLAPDWTWGLDDVPGWDAQNRILRVTHDADITVDSQDRAVGFLGRAHPLVRRALDRVRNLQYGGDETSLDRRVAVASHDGSGPLAVLTYLVRVHSELGREFERVIAVRVGPDGEPVAELSPEAWLARGDLERAVVATGVWQASFSSWLPGRQSAAAVAAQAASTGLIDAFVAVHSQDLDRELGEVTDWVRVRADDLCPRTPPTMMGLFDAAAPAAQPAWMTSTVPTERLAGFATDGRYPARARAEAEGVLRLYQRRHRELDRRRHLRPAELVSLGMLLLVPAKGA
jgi:superfamily II DNA or RNA helicase